MVYGVTELYLLKKLAHNYSIWIHYHMNYNTMKLTLFLKNVQYQNEEHLQVKSMTSFLLEMLLRNK